MVWSLKNWSGLVFGIAGLLASASASGQEFRVFTVVTDAAAVEAGQKSPVISRSVTLFHAGKVYDYVDQAGEVVIFEPSARRFTVLHPQRRIATTAAFDEIRQLMKVAREEYEQVASEVNANPSHDSRTLAFMRFQLTPRFQEKFDESSQALTLSGEQVKYQVIAAPPKQSEFAEAYLSYTDWMSQLNYLIHPGPLLPQSRMTVNQALRSRGKIPLAVELTTDTTPKIALKAEHTFYWELDSEDRRLIQQWETQLKAERTKKLPLREYQREIFAARSDR